MTQKADFDIRTNIMPEDIPGIMEIEMASFSDPWPLSGVERELTNPYGMYAIAHMDGRPVGYVMGTALMEDCDITNVAVAPEYRRRGMAKAMLESFLSQCRQQGVRRVLLEVRESNAGARALYGSFGFEPKGVRPRYYDYPTEDAVLMVVDLC